MQITDEVDLLILLHSELLKYIDLDILLQAALEIHGISK